MVAAFSSTGQVRFKFCHPLIHAVDSLSPFSLIDNINAFAGDDGITMLLTEFANLAIIINHAVRTNNDAIVGDDTKERCAAMHIHLISKSVPHLSQTA